MKRHRLSRGTFGGPIVSRTIVLGKAIVIGIGCLSAFAALGAGTDPAASTAPHPMAVAATTPSPSTLVVMVSIQPNPPVMGDNTLNFQVIDPHTGAAVSGLTLSATTTMTSMDMGVARTAAREIGKGRYQAVAHFGMNGPWRVLISGSGPGGRVSTALDFLAGGKELWSQAASGTANAGTTVGDGGAIRPAGSSAMPPGTPMDDAMPGMSMKQTNGRSTAVPDRFSALDTPGRPIRLIPRLQEERVVMVTGDEDWNSRTGFGKNAPMVNMMNQMMVEGSGMEHMKMPPMRLDFGPKNFTDADAGMAATPGMTAPGMAAPGAAAPGAAAPGIIPVTVTITPNPPAVGDNVLNIEANDPRTGQPLTGLQLTTTVQMATMDMGTTHPTAREVSPGRYQATIKFSMAGPWRVTVSGKASNGEPVESALTFNAGGNGLWSQPAPASDQNSQMRAMPGLEMAPNAMPAMKAASGDLAPAASGSANGGPAADANMPAVSAPGATPGMTVSGASAPAPGRAAQKRAPAHGLKIAAVITKPMVGENKLLITVTDKKGRPVTGALITTVVAMTTMDMGSAHPTVKETGHGHYVATVTFLMAGPWRVTVTALAPGEKKTSQSFVFTARR